MNCCAIAARRRGQGHRQAAHLGRQTFADEIGAEGYGYDAGNAVELVKRADGRLVMLDLRKRLTSGEILCGDGAWGTELMARGLAPGDCFEAVNLSRPGDPRRDRRAYIEAGAELITTNTFGGSPLNLTTHDLADRTEEINRAAVEALRGVTAGRALISGSVGPTGKILTPYGDTEPAAMAERILLARSVALINAGADLICIETMMDLEEARLAVEAAARHSGTIPIIATMTFNATPRGFFTTMGQTPDRRARDSSKPAPISSVPTAATGSTPWSSSPASSPPTPTVPIVIQSNAGLPENRAGELHYPEGPDDMAAKVGELINLGVAVIGGCCGTGPDHIRAIRAAIDRHQDRP